MRWLKIKTTLIDEMFASVMGEYRRVHIVVSAIFTILTYKAGKYTQNPFHRKPANYQTDFFPPVFLDASQDASVMPCNGSYGGGRVCSATLCTSDT
jgi:hypothetical protein